MRNRAEEIRAGLEADHPGWQVWVVWRVVGGPLYCARRKDDSGPPVSSGDPDELAWEIEQAEG
jgi:hypothetical protein